MIAQELISSGKLELYVAGVLSEREMAHVAVVAMEYPEVALEIEKIEQVMIEFLSPAEFRMDETDREKEIDTILDKIHADSKLNGGYAFAASAPPGARVRKMNSLPFNLAVAALLIGLVIATGLTILFGARDAHLSKEVAALKSKEQGLVSNNERFQDTLSHMQQQVNIMRNILTKRIQLTNVAGNKITGQDNYMLVYWNPQSKKLLLVDANLPNLDAQQQYQLWALYDGKPIDAGVFDYKNLQVSSSFQKDIPNAQAFAVTVEPKGGSKSPTLSNLCMMGKL